MKKRLITAGIVAAVLAIAAVLFWPHTKTYSFSGVATEWSRSWQTLIRKQSKHSSQL